MFATLAMLILLLGAQLSPTLTPHPAPKPTLPKIDQNACPFEGCQFGAWTAREPVQLYTTWKEDRKPLKKLAAGEVVTAVTGVNITYEPMEAEVTKAIPAYGLKPGDVVYGYMNLGEGVFNAWFNGQWVEEFDGSGIEGAGCNRGCTARMLKPGRFAWWVEIKTEDSAVGWSDEGDKFDGKDALGGGSRQ